MRRVLAGLALLWSAWAGVAEAQAAPDAAQQINQYEAVLAEKDDPSIR